MLLYYSTICKSEDNIGDKYRRRKLRKIFKKSVKRGKFGWKLICSLPILLLPFLLGALRRASG